MNPGAAVYTPATDQKLDDFAGGRKRINPQRGNVKDKGSQCHGDQNQRPLEPGIQKQRKTHIAAAAQNAHNHHVVKHEYRQHTAVNANNIQRNGFYFDACVVKALQTGRQVHADHKYRNAGRDAQITAGIGLCGFKVAFADGFAALDGARIAKPNKDDIAHFVEGVKNAGGSRHLRAIRA